jgi:hypothetical protein
MLSQLVFVFTITQFTGMAVTPLNARTVSDKLGIRPFDQDGK